VAEFPNLKVVMEHITTKEAVEFVQRASDNVAATITCHHLLHSRNGNESASARMRSLHVFQVVRLKQVVVACTDIFVGGIRPHMYCLPVLKRETHRQSLLAAATSGNPKFFLGTDSAPHAVEAKLSSCGISGSWLLPVDSLFWIQSC
jgi:dihydroorotase